MKDRPGQPRHFPFPMIGQRMVKTGAAVFICLLIYILRGYRGMVIQSAIAAIICMQPYARDSRRLAGNRITGTVLGGVWGLLFLLLMEYVPVLSRSMPVVYLLMTIGVIAVLYTCVLLKVTDTAALAAIVFLCVIITYPVVESPFRQTADRIIDTIIGVCVAIAVNSLHLPTRKHPEKVFFLHLKDIAADRYAIVPSRIMIELNRLYDEGARICLETSWAPAFMISQMNTVRVNMPFIVMDGAALYDMRENAYYELMAIPHEAVGWLRARLRELGFCVCIFAVRSNTMLIFHDGEKSSGELEDYETMRRTPYRNYMDGMYTREDSVIAVRILSENADAAETARLLSEDASIREGFCVMQYGMTKPSGRTGFYFYRKDVSIRHMEERLLNHIREQEGAEAEAVRILPLSLAYDPERDAHLLLHRIGRQYMTPWIGRKGSDRAAIGQDPDLRGDESSGKKQRG